MAYLAVGSLRLAPTCVVSLDISSKMIELARKKVSKQSVTDIIELQINNSVKLQNVDALDP